MKRRDEQLLKKSPTQPTKLCNVAYAALYEVDELNL